MEHFKRDLNTIRLDGGVLCLDFVNSIHDRFNDDSEDYLHSYADLLVWSQLASAITEDEASQLHRLVTIYPTKSAAAFNETIAFRENLYQVLLHFVNGEPIPETALVACNAIFTQMWGNLELRPDHSHFAWTWRADAFGLRYPMWKIAHSAATLLTSDDTTRIKTCERCGWLFLDTSRNKSRRWCSMETCGNRTKAARHYHKNQS